MKAPCRVRKRPAICLRVRKAGWGAAACPSAIPSIRLSACACPPVFLALPSCAAATARKRPIFRSFFDSGKARQTVRWRRFFGPGFAPVFAVNAGVSGCFQALKSLCRVRKRLAIGLCGFGKRAGARPPAIAPARLPVRPSFWRFRHAQPSRPARGRFFRSFFDSGKARQTVRWRRFLGLEFALKKGVMRMGAGRVQACVMASSCSWRRPSRAASTGAASAGLAWPVWIREAGWGAATRHCASPLACPSAF